MPDGQNPYEAIGAQASGASNPYDAIGASAAGGNPYDAVGAQASSASVAAAQKLLAIDAVPQPTSITGIPHPSVLMRGSQVPASQIKVSGNAPVAQTVTALQGGSPSEFGPIGYHPSGSSVPLVNGKPTQRGAGEQPAPDSPSPVNKSYITPGVPGGPSWDQIQALIKAGKVDPRDMSYTTPKTQSAMFRESVNKGDANVSDFIRASGLAGFIPGVKDVISGLAAGTVMFPANVLAEVSTLSDPNESTENQLGAAANLAVMAATPKVLHGVAKGAGKVLEGLGGKILDWAASKASAGDAGALTHILNTGDRVGVDLRPKLPEDLQAQFDKGNIANRGVPAAGDVPPVQPSTIQGPPVATGFEPVQSAEVASPAVAPDAVQPSATAPVDRFGPLAARLAELEAQKAPPVAEPAVAEPKPQVAEPVRISLTAHVAPEHMSDDELIAHVKQNVPPELRSDSNPYWNELQRRATGSNAEPVKTERFAEGKKLTPAERAKALSKIGDSYEDLGHERTFKGLNKKDEEIYGYEYSPDHMHTSDITGAKIRHYITLPDGRIAHPSELFPDISESKAKSLAEVQRANYLREGFNGLHDGFARKVISGVTEADISRLGSRLASGPESKAYHEALKDFDALKPKIAEAYNAKAVALDQLARDARDGKMRLGSAFKTIEDQAKSYEDAAGGLREKAKSYYDAEKPTSKLADFREGIDQRLSELEKTRKGTGGGMERGSVNIGPQDFEYVALKAIKFALDTGETVVNAVKRFAAEHGFTDEHTKEALKWAKSYADQIDLKPEEFGEEAKAETPPVPTTGARNAVTEAERAARGVEPVERQHYTTPKEAHTAGQEAVKSGEIDHEALSREVATNPRPLTAKEVGALTEGRRRLTNEINASRNALDSAIAAKSPNVPALQDAYEAAKTKLAVNDEALVKGGREQSAAFLARTMGTELDSGNFAQMAAEARRAKGGELTPTAEAQIKAATDAHAKAVEAYAKLSAEHDAAKAKIAELEARRVTAAVQRQARSQARAVDKGRLQAERSDILTKLAQLSSQASANPVDKIAEGSKLLGKLAVNVIKDGALTLADVVDRVNAHLKDAGMPEKSPREIHDALSGYGREATGPTKSEVQTRVGELKRIAALSSQIADREAGAVKGRPKIVSTKAPTVEALEAKIADLKGQDVVKKRIAELDRRIKENDFPTPEAKAKGSADLEDLRKQAGNKQRQAAVQQQINELERQLRTGDFPTEASKAAAKARRAAALEAEPPELKEARRIKDLTAAKVKDAIEAQKPKSFARKFTMLQQANLLSSPTVFGKLVAATGGHVVMAPVEEGLGALIGKVAPGFREAAGTELRGSIQAEAKAVSALLNPETYKSAVQKLLHGHNELDARAYAQGIGKGYNEQGNAILRFLRNSHGAVKTPLQHSAFEREYAKVMEEFARNGEAITDSTRSQAFLRAYDASQRAILMNDSAASKFIRSAIELPARSGLRGGEVTTAFLRTLMPITRVPVNFIGRSLEYQFGIPYAGVKAILERGRYTPESSAAIARALKRGGVGAGLMMTGALASKEIKVDEKDNLVVGNTTIPPYLSHIPWLQAFKMGVIFRDTLGGSSEKGLNAGFKSLTSTVRHAPGVDVAQELSRILETRGSDETHLATAGKIAGGWIGNVAIPQPLQQYARGALPLQPRGLPGADSPDVDRSPKGFKDAVKEALPHFRQQVPVRVKK